MEDKELYQDLAVVYNEIEEVSSFIEQQTEEDVIENINALKRRLDDALYWLSKYVNEENLSQ